MGLRFFIVGDDDSLRRVSVQRFEKFLLSRDKSIRFPEFASRDMRYVEVIVEVENRRPVGVTPRGYKVPVNSRGVVDEKKMMERVRLAMSGMEPVMPDPNKPSGAHRFYAKRAKEELMWKPSTAVIQAIRDAILGPKG